MAIASSDLALASSNLAAVASANDRWASAATAGSPGTDRRIERSRPTIDSALRASPGMATR